MKASSVIALSSLVISSLGVSLDLSDKDSVCKAAKAVADGEWNYYEGLKYGGTVGVFSPPYYWWHAGEAFGGLVDYYTYCDNNNDTLKNIISDGMYHQAGDDYDYMPKNQTNNEANDDQGVWGIALMHAAERNFPDPSRDDTWGSLAEAVFNSLNSRWDEKNCGGGLRWQILSSRDGYDYKNTITNGYYINLASRLARYYNNNTYVDTASKVWDWMDSVSYFNENDNSELMVYDGAHTPDCNIDYDTTSWSYNYGVYLASAAYLYDFTKDDKWKDRAVKIMKRSIDLFQKQGIMTEISCQPDGDCNNDQRAFRGLFSRHLGLASSLIPSAKLDIQDFLEKSAKGAATSCSGGTDGVTCGQDWTADGWDGMYGLGEQMCALEVILANKASDMTIHTA